MANTSDDLRQDREELQKSVIYHVGLLRVPYQCDRYPINILLQLAVHIIQTFLSLCHTVLLEFPLKKN